MLFTPTYVNPVGRSQDTSSAARLQARCFHLESNFVLAEINEVPIGYNYVLCFKSKNDGRIQYVINKPEGLYISGNVLCLRFWNYQ